MNQIKLFLLSIVFSSHRILIKLAMDYQNRVGSKKGGGGVADTSETNAYRRERLKKLVTSSIDIDNDPYVFKNHVGMLECRLCSTTHATPESFLTHTQGRKHQMNLQKRAIQEAKHTNIDPITGQPRIIQGNGLTISAVKPKKSLAKFGRPGYKIKKIRHPVSSEVGLQFTMRYPELVEDSEPQFRFMSSYEQRVETNPDENFQYLIVSGEHYENVAFKIPSKEIYRDDNNDKFWTFWDEDTKEFFIQFFYKDI